MTGLVLLHGWGCGPEIWRHLASAFGPAPVVVLDAGYFGPRRMLQPDLLPDSLPGTLPENADGWVGVGYSLGFARLLEMGAAWRGLVGVSGFLRFCRQPDTAGGAMAGASPEVLDAMLQRLDSAPEEVLARFHKRCGLRNEICQKPAAEGLARLRRDLLDLRGLDLRDAELRQGPARTLLIHAQDDRIAPPDLAREAQAQLPGSRLELLDTGGHALPVTRSQDCLRLIMGFLHDLG
ncbi:MAG: alpha/beta hydrolase [Proteobacteria bacterium]|nr:alpha/beta hydrolase [Pseudomonadota bacterium]MBU1594755.1 alpha/beta hydrolase [Pseudomonadota bacterium]